MKVLVTGSSGFIGQNCIANLSLQPDIEIYTFDVQDSSDVLERYTGVCDIALHFAGVNRPKDEEDFAIGNTELTTRLIALLERREKPIPLMLSSSIQAQVDNPYGKSKKAAEDAAFAYAARTGAKAYVYRFPNVFGKWCRPNYNSVVATFCHNAATGLPLRVDAPEKELSLVYVDDIVSEMEALIEGKIKPLDGGFCTVNPVYSITLGALAELIQGFASSRENLTHDYDRQYPFLRKLYATFTSYLPPDRLSIGADMKHDERGFFAELIKSPHFGQISVSRTKPGIVRGNHWHSSKVEKFIVIEGEAVIRLRKYATNDAIEYQVSGERIEMIDIPAGYTHSIQNVGQTDVLTLFWAGEMFDPTDTDTFALEV